MFHQSRILQLWKVNFLYSFTCLPNWDFGTLRSRESIHVTFAEASSGPSCRLSAIHSSSQPWIPPWCLLYLPAALPWLTPQQEHWTSRTLCLQICWGTLPWPLPAKPSGRNRGQPSWLNKAESSRASRKKLRPTESPAKGTLLPAELLAGCAVGSRFPTFVSCHPRWHGSWWCSCLWAIFVL